MTRRAKYLYPKGPKKPHEWIACRACGDRALVQAHGKGFCSVRCAQTGKNNSHWAGGEVGYVGAHARVYRARGPATSCVFGDHPGPYDWANLMGDLTDPNDYAMMCRSCHNSFDGAQKKCFDYICPEGHSFEQDGYYSRITEKGEVRCCKECSKMRAQYNRRKKARQKGGQ